jgi:hypothetical protein
MEGHPTDEEHGKSPAPDDRDSVSARRRAFLLLDRERASLRARRRAPWRPLGRYEDLCVVSMLTRLERDWLFQPSPRPPRGDPSRRGEPFGRGVADWAKPWRLSPLTTLEADARRLEGARRRCGKWLSPLGMAEGERRARERLERITSQLEARHPPPPVTASGGPDGWAEKPGVFASHSRFRMAAIAGLLLLFGAGATVGSLAAFHGDGGSGDSLSPPVGTERGVFQRPPGLGVGARARQASGGRGVGQRTRRSSRPARHPDRRRSHPAPRREAPRSLPVASSTASSSGQVPEAERAAVPLSVPQAAPVPEPAPPPQPPDSPPSRTSSNAQATGGQRGCPPEFGYEC